ncbi:phosphatidate cytidylyltransferase, mitochondrial isoform X3 [Malaclemys terrapin pileata]|uniref:phosphatidate cytidylyltransferase, mitochondrial isoform X3 n=1 Tax=Malaclemys terrapin pileata TaxID=2991368 RepID=UPI0023A8A36F|nr:phosphatidate cytidylyltransferase, mitochondrial isoform X3 [Malaclemys terrapin pileata]
MALPALPGSGVQFRRILAHFPQELSLAFAYGSGVFRQAGAAPSQSVHNMLDFVFAVDDSVTWHMMNLLKNRSHYSFLKLFGPKQISNIQSCGAGIYYNTLVQCNGRMIKYGIIGTDALIEDLFHWKTLYVAGRLQKPKRVFGKKPPFFDSLLGDFRMIIGEDRSKVLNIVKPNVPHFQKLYSNILQECPQVVYKHQLGRLEIDKSPEGQFMQLMALPRTLQQKITSFVDPPGKNRDVEEVLLKVAHDPDCGLVVHQGISGIVRSSSLIQSSKTILTAGFKKSVTYSMKKMYKMTKGWLRKTS